MQCRDFSYFYCQISCVLCAMCPAKIEKKKNERWMKAGTEPRPLNAAHDMCTLPGCLNNYISEIAWKRRQSHEACASSSCIRRSGIVCFVCTVYITAAYRLCVGWCTSILLYSLMVQLIHENRIFLRHQFSFRFFSLFHNFFFSYWNVSRQNGIMSLSKGMPLERNLFPQRACRKALNSIWCHVGKHKEKCVFTNSMCNQ